MKRKGLFSRQTNSPNSYFIFCYEFSLIINTDLYNADFNTAWDFHLQSGSPALSKGKTDFTPHFKDGIMINGVNFQSPEPADYIGAFGTK